MFNFERATQPTIYFIGVSTGSSSIMRVFPKWAQALGLTNAVIKGIDLPLHAPAQAYRSIVDFIKGDPLSEGALVTTHKIDLYNACKDQFDLIDPYAQMLGEVSSLSKDGAKLCAYAKDPISSGLALEAFVPENFWTKHGGEVVLMGAGGSSLAMAVYLAQERWGENLPRKIIITNRSTPRLESAKKLLSVLRQEACFEYIHCPTAAENDAVIATLPPYSLVVNATGLGKDAPGSPTTDTVSYPPHCLVWEINYRGELVFMQQALAQKEKNHLQVEDGWTYFIHGWTQVIAEVFHIKIEGELLERLSNIAQFM